MQQRVHQSWVHNTDEVKQRLLNLWHGNLWHQIFVSAIDSAIDDATDESWASSNM